MNDTDQFRSDLTEKATLEACPFCGDVGHIFALPEPSEFAVQCVGCGAASAIVTAIMDSPIAALEHVWNRRQYPMSDGARAVLKERAQHFSREGRTSSYDDGHIGGELALAAAEYAMVSTGRYGTLKGGPSHVWPWSPQWFKPTTPHLALVKAGALIIAELDRIDRMYSTEEPF